MSAVPRTSTLCFAAQYILYSTMITAAACITTVLIMYVHNCGAMGVQMPKWAKWLTTPICCGKRTDNDDDDADASYVGYMNKKVQFICSFRKLNLDFAD